MAYSESVPTKLLKLLKEPGVYVPKIYPYIKGKIEPYRRDVFEFFGSQSISNPYPDSKKLYAYLNKTNGYFVQVGGNDGYGFDPTYQLEKFYGWKGIIVEPLPIHKLCARNRKKSVVVNKACVPFSYQKNEIEFIDCNFMSFPSGSRDDEQAYTKLGETAQNIHADKITVPASPLQDILDKWKPTSQPIDLLVIDVEGYELPVLQGINFEKNLPKFLLLEIKEDKRFENIGSYLDPFGYQYKDTIDEADRLFMLK